MSGARSTQRWWTLAGDVRDTGTPARRDPVHLDMVRARVDPAVAQEELEREIVREIAGALGRSAEKVERALARLESGRHAVEAARDLDERARAIAGYKELRLAAIRARHDLLVHREAVGIRRNAALETLYPIPPSLTRPAR
ncbi:MAG TPA: hypothetical protein VGK30_10815 [Candidatus Binatia bacterium]|jgi:hypothetical protein